MFNKNITLSKIFKVIILLELLAIVCLGALNFRSPKILEKVTIELTNSGFTPQEVFLKPGGTVTFVNKRNSHFWPASDDHPTHTIYPEFDSHEALDPNESWDFTFIKTGTWKYHDHLSVAFTGIIHVSNDINDNKQSLCHGNFECWKESLLASLESEGLDKTYDLIEKLYKQYPDFAESCHNLAHDMGNASYRLYVKNPESVLSAKASYCANGFYHGFGEGLFGATGDINEVKKFCEFVKDKLSAAAPDSELQCYHGAGHGIMEQIISGTGVKLVESQIINPSLVLCEKISDNDEQLYRCASGVYNGIANFYMSGEYGLKPNELDPLSICHVQPDKHKESCYGNMNVTILWLTKNDFRAAAKFVEKIKDDKYAIPAIRYLSGASSLRLAKSEPEKAAQSCRQLQKRLLEACIVGFAHGFLEHGTPQTEYLEAFAFCENGKLNNNEKEICYRYSLIHLGGWYSKDKAVSICSKVEEKYKKYCTS